MSSLFCRHNRFTADCPICSKDSVLSRETVERVKPAKPSTPRSSKSRGAKPAVTRYPHVSVVIDAHEVRLEQVPGGLRLAQWRGGALERKAPVLPASALKELFDEARGRGYVKFDVDEVPTADTASPGRAGDMQEELRLEHTGDGLIRVARWIFWPGAGVGWELQDSPVMLPEQRFEQLLTGT